MSVDVYVVISEGDYEERDVLRSAHVLLGDALRAAREHPEDWIVIVRCSPLPAERWTRKSRSSVFARLNGGFDVDLYEHETAGADGVGWHRLGQYRFDVDAPSDRFAQTVEAAERLMQAAADMRTP